MNKAWGYYESQWSSDNTVLITAVVSYICNVYNSFIINVDCFAAYWLLAAFINIFQCNEHVVK